MYLILNHQLLVSVPFYLGSRLYQAYILGHLVFPSEFCLNLDLSRQWSWLDAKGHPGEKLSKIYSS